MSTRHELMDGKLHVYRRPGSNIWQVSASVGRRQHRESTKLDSLAEAKDFAEDWYLDLKGKLKRGEIRAGGKTFKFAAEAFLKDAEAEIAHERSPSFIYGHRKRLDVHLLPFFGKRALTEITPAFIQQYRVHRQTSRKNPRTLKYLKDRRTGRVRRDEEGRMIADPDSGVVARPSRSSMHKEIVTLRQVLKYANRQGWIPYVPDLSSSFRASGKVSHRPWFSPEEYKTLYTATRKRSDDPPKPRWAHACEELHDLVLFAGNTGLRPDELARLEFRDVEIIDDDDTDERILLIEVRGKRGVGFCKSMPGAVEPFRRLSKRVRRRRAANDDGSGRNDTSNKKGMGLPTAKDRVFERMHPELFKTVLVEEDLREDREGRTRTLYSLRHTYICMRLMAGANVYEVAKNCRTSVEMIQKHYAAHISTSIDASAVNVKARRKAKKKARTTTSDAA